MEFNRDDKVVRYGDSAILTVVRLFKADDTGEPFYKVRYESGETDMVSADELKPASIRESKRLKEGVFKEELDVAEELAKNGPFNPLKRPELAKKARQLCKDLEGLEDKEERVSTTTNGNQEWKRCYFIAFEQDGPFYQGVNVTVKFVSRASSKTDGVQDQVLSVILKRASRDAEDYELD